MMDGDQRHHDQLLQGQPHAACWFSWQRQAGKVEDGEDDAKKATGA